MFFLSRCFRHRSDRLCNDEKHNHNFLNWITLRNRRMARSRPSIGPNDLRRADFDYVGLFWPFARLANVRCICVRDIAKSERVASKPVPSNRCDDNHLSIGFSTKNLRRWQHDSWKSRIYLSFCWVAVVACFRIWFACIWFATNSFSRSQRRRHQKMNRQALVFSDAMIFGEIIGQKSFGKLARYGFPAQIKSSSRR